MAALLWARPMFALILLALVGRFVWTAWETEAKYGASGHVRRQTGNQE